MNLPEILRDNGGQYDVPYDNGGDNILQCVTVGQYFAICGGRGIYGRSRNASGITTTDLCCDQNQLKENNFLSFFTLSITGAEKY